ncbi:hypothetical protein Dimus_029993 [Dionaea muscipula]
MIDQQFRWASSPEMVSSEDGVLNSLIFQSRRGRERAAVEKQNCQRERKSRNAPSISSLSTHNDGRAAEAGDARRTVVSIGVDGGNSNIAIDGGSAQCRRRQLGVDRGNLVSMEAALGVDGAVEAALGVDGGNSILAGIRHIRAVSCPIQACPVNNYHEYVPEAPEACFCATPIRVRYI